MIPEWEADEEEVAARLEAIHKTDANHMRLEPETEHQDNMEPNNRQKGGHSGAAGES
jgi:hypothetical protein